MVDKNAWQKFRDFVIRAKRKHNRSPSYADGGLVSYTGTINAHRPPIVDVTRQSKLPSIRETEMPLPPEPYAMPHSGFIPSSDHMPPSTGMIMLREGETMSPFLALGSRSPQPVKNNPKVEKPSSLKKVNKERMQRKMDTDD